MKKLLLLALALTSGYSAQSQTFSPEIDVTDWEPTTIQVPQSPLITQYLFIGGHDFVQTTATYGNAADTALAKQWHDFIGFTPDTSNSGDLGWVSVNHEMVVQNDKIGDGGGMTVFKVRRDPATDSLIVVSQTLSDGRSGEYFAVDFANTVGETGMNCGGISASNGRIWTAEEWWRGSNADLADRDTGAFTIGTGTANYSAPNGFPGFDGQTIAKYENYNYMVEIDPREAVAIRKQYNWGRQPFEGGCVMPDNKTVYLGADNTPGFFTKFVADNAGDFTSGSTYVYKHDATGSKWVEIDNSNVNKMLNFSFEAVSLGATMFNRIEWVVEIGGKVYFTETGRDNPGSRWRGAAAAGAVYAPHHVQRAIDQSAEFGKTITPDSSEYWDYYGRVMVYDPATEMTSVFLEGGPYFTVDPSIASYPDKHLSNPDGLSKITINGEDYMLINEDLNGTSKGRTPAGISNRTCEMFILPMSISNPSLNDLVRVAVVPVGAEITGAIGTPDGKTIMFNSQHPSTSNPFPYNNSMTVAITGWDQVTIGLPEDAFEGEAFQMYPNPATRTLYFNESTDVAIYDVNGKRMNVYRNVESIDISHLSAGVYYVQNAEGTTQKLLVK